MPLSDLTIRKALPREKPFRLSDGDGLHLLVQPSGGNLWQFRHRHGGKANIQSLGKCPVVTLAEARQKRDAARRRFVKGTDLSAQRKLDKIAAETAARQTFGLVADEYLDNLKANGAAESTLAKTSWLLRDLAAPLANRPIRASRRNGRKPETGYPWPFWIQSNMRALEFLRSPASRIIPGRMR